MGTEGGELGVPGEGVAAEELAVGLGEAGDGVGGVKGEDALARLDGLPLLAVLGHVHAELVGVVGDGAVGPVVEVVGLDGRAKVQLAGVDHEAVQALGLRGHGRRGGLLPLGEEGAGADQQAGGEQQEHAAERHGGRSGEREEQQKSSAGKEESKTRKQNRTVSPGTQKKDDPGYHPRRYKNRGISLGINAPGTPSPAADPRSQAHCTRRRQDQRYQARGQAGQGVACLSLRCVAVLLYPSAVVQDLRCR